MDKYTIKDFNQDFPNDDACLEWLVSFLYPDGVPCRKCSCVTKHHRITGRPAFVCDHCGTHVYPMTDTIFEKSATPLRLWFYVIYLMASTRCGISAKQVQRETGVTYKTAWRMCHMVREMLADEPDPHIGSFEVDEAFIGGKSKHPVTYKSKTRVLGIADRKGHVHAYPVPNMGWATIGPILRRHAQEPSTIYSDSAKGYERLGIHGYDHRWFNKKQKQVIRGVNINRLEGFWSVLKRGITGVYYHVGKAYVQTYINEYAFRYNHRDDDRPMFLAFLSRVASA
jgi:transposase-like protein